MKWTCQEKERESRKAEQQYLDWGDEVDMPGESRKAEQQPRLGRRSGHARRAGKLSSNLDWGDEVDMPGESRKAEQQYLDWGDEVDMPGEQES